MTSIEGTLSIINNDALISLSGLDNLITIGVKFYLKRNDALTNLSGLDNLTTIGDMVWVLNNISLTSLTALSNVTSIGGELIIEGNTTLTSLAGLEHINYASIGSLYIRYNSNLSTCEVQSICDYLANPNGNISIHDNATGCNSQSEVEEACVGIGVPEMESETLLLIYPNPLSTSTTIEYKLPEPALIHLFINNYLGEQVQVIVNEYQAEGNHRFTWSPENLLPGVYYCILKTKDGIQTTKLIKL